MTVESLQYNDSHVKLVSTLYASSNNTVGKVYTQSACSTNM